MQAHLGEEVEKGARLGVITSPSGRQGQEVVARMDGMILGHAVNPLVHQGDGLIHLAEIEDRGHDPQGEGDLAVEDDERTG